MRVYFMTNARYARREVTGDEREPLFKSLKRMRDTVPAAYRYATLPVLLASVAAYSFFGYVMPSSVQGVKAEQQATTAFARTIQEAAQTGNEQLLSIINAETGNSFKGSVLIPPNSSSGSKQLARITLSALNNEYVDPNAGSPVYGSVSGYVKSDPLVYSLNKSSNGAIVEYLDAQQGPSGLPVFIISACATVLSVWWKRQSYLINEKGYMLYP